MMASTARLQNFEGPNRKAGQRLTEIASSDVGRPSDPAIPAPTLASGIRDTDEYVVYEY
jgi:hypothetical protein